MRKFLFLSLMMLICSVSFAQSNVTGKVTSADGQPVPFAGVFVKGTMNGVSTADDGSYILPNVPSNSTIVFSCIGFIEQEVEVNGRTKIDVILAADTESLDEVMVIAYGTAKKGTYTGSAASVGKDQFEMRPVTGITQALAGTTAGVQVGTSNGMPGSAPTIHIRGLGSFSASTTPLVVLDGMPYDGDISSINPNDIESITVLKDASSAALYGARAANGVLMINTKKGRSDMLSVTASYSVGFTNRQTKDYETLDTPDYMQMWWEAMRNANMYGGYSKEDASAMAGGQLLTGMGYNAYGIKDGSGKFVPSTAAKLFDPETGALLPGNELMWADDLDWRSYVERTGIRHDANVSISGGSKKSDYYTSIGYTNDEGYIVGSSLTRYSLNSRVNSQITDWLKVGTSVNASVKDREGEQTEASGNNSNPFRFIRYVGNIYPVHVHYANGDYYLNNGEKVYDFGIGYELPDGTMAPKRDFITQHNYAAETAHVYEGYQKLALDAKAYVEITFLKDFKFTMNSSFGETSTLSHAADVVYAEKSNVGTASLSTGLSKTWNHNQLLTYNKDFGKNHIDALIGHESYSYTGSSYGAYKKNQIIKGDNYELVNYTDIDEIPSSSTSYYRVEGYLSRLNYDYDEKYFASASYRRDGTSRFYKDVRWGNFWSVGAGWRIDKEDFMSNAAWVDLLKLRASYGSVGNDDLGSYYPWLAAYSKKDDSIYAAYTQTSLGNTELTWEVSTNLDVALEWNLFKGVFNGELEFFNRQSSNLLFDIPIPVSAGIDYRTMNAGTMYNRGFEFTFDVNVLRTNDFNWNINGNLTYLKNRITYLPVDPYVSSPYKIEEGHPIYEFYLRQWMGVNPENGYCMYKADIDNEDIVWEDGELYEYNGVQVTEDIDHAVREWSGQSMPPFMGGLGMNFKYKNFTLSFDTYFHLGGLFYDSTYASLMTAAQTTSSPGYHKFHVDILDRWQKPGDVTDVPRLASGTDNQNTDAGSSTRWLTTSNMFELTNFSLAYDVPARACSALGIQGAKIYCSGDNMYLLAARRGMFPRRNTYSGYDGNSDIYLPARTISFGVKLNF